jgi:PAS domain-containing protein
LDWPPLATAGTATAGTLDCVEDSTGSSRSGSRGSRCCSPATVPRARAHLRNLAAAIEEVEALVVIVSPDDRVEYVNRALCRHLGKSNEELLGRSWGRSG